MKTFRQDTLELEKQRGDLLAALFDTFSPQILTALRSDNVRWNAIAEGKSIVGLKKLLEETWNAYSSGDALALQRYYSDLKWLEGTNLYKFMEAFEDAAESLKKAGVPIPPGQMGEQFAKHALQKRTPRR